MREFKKYFFDGLLQLTILATLLRHNNDLNEHSLSSPGFSTREADEFYTQYYLNLKEAAPSTANRLLSDELRLLNRLNARQQHRPPLLPPQRFIIAPSYRYLNNSNQKDIINLSETRLLLNSIEFNNNQLTKEDIEMDIDIQTIIQQDIDLGIKKSLQYGYEFDNSGGSNNGASSYDGSQASSTGASSDNDFGGYFNKYFGENVKPDQPNEFFSGPFKPPHLDPERQKNEDILRMENLFANQPVPDGYKLILEEDTGEWFMIMMRNDTMNRSVSQTQHVYQQQQQTTNNFSSIQGLNEQNVEIDINELFRNDHQQPIDIVEIATSNAPLTPLTPRVEFLSQTSVYRELGKLTISPCEAVDATAAVDHQATVASQVVCADAGEQQQTAAVLNNGTNLISALNDTLTNIEPNLLDEEWITSFLLGNSVTAATVAANPSNSSEQQSQVLPVQQQQRQPSIGNDAMLSTLNANNSVILNEAAVAASVVGNSTESAVVEFTLLNNTESLELLFNPLILDSDPPRITDHQLVHSPSLSSSSSSSPSSASSLNTGRSSSSGGADLFTFGDEIETRTFDLHTLSIVDSIGSSDDTAKRVIANNLLHQHQQQLEQQQQQSSLINTFIIKEEAVDLDIPSTHNRRHNNHRHQKKQSNHQHVLYADMSGGDAETQHKDENNDEEDDVKWSHDAALAGLHHNHTYLGTSDSSSATGGGHTDQGVDLHPYSYKSKLLKRMRQQQQADTASSNSSSSLSRNQSRDEQAMREAGIGARVRLLEDVVESSADDFNEMIRVNAFTAEQVVLLKDIRRRGKNKVAAQICRKRKLDSIDSLRDEVDGLRSFKAELIAEYKAIHDEIKEMTSKFDSLYKDAVGANNYASNDPIVVFINDLKKLNAESQPSLLMDEAARARPAMTMTGRDRKKTFNSINSSDFDSTTFTDEDYEEDDDEDFDDDDDDDDEYDEEDDEDDVDSLPSPKTSVAAAATMKTTPTTRNINKKFKRN